MQSYIWLIPTLPLVAFLVNLVLGKRYLRGASAWVAAGSVAAAFVLAVLLFRQVAQLGTIDSSGYAWISSGAFTAPIGLHVDQLAALMLLVVTGVSLLVHVYSIGYMHGDEGYYRFFAYLPLFTFSMVMLVLANNYLELYVFWEAVGVCSYLLIGFWYERRSASAAAMKAFIVNRVGDFGFGLGVLLIFATFGTLQYSEVFRRAEQASPGVLTAITLLLFMGSMGKSAQWPLHTWLPDAMEGPTPVSALIHAATMVTAGVYLVARSAPLFERATGTLAVVTVIGLVTALLGASIGLVQRDIKRVMAYSTISQLGYMFIALGVGAYASAIFHLFTHAFFKALLFLGAGSVMHGMDGETDMARMGGLRRYMPQTFITVTIGAMALAGVPGLSGFWSKDEILGSAFNGGHVLVYALGTLASFLTAFYVTRMVVLTFLGKPRFDVQSQHPHESPLSMVTPLWVLAVLAVVAGYVGVPPDAGVLHSWLAPVFHAGSAAEGEAGGFSPSVLLLMLAASAVSLGGILLALGAYLWRVPALDPGLWIRRTRPLYEMLVNRYYFDHLYTALFVRPTVALGNRLWKVDAEGVDAAVVGAASAVSSAGGSLRKTQTGFVGNYALGIALGVAALVTYLVVRS